MAKFNASSKGSDSVANYMGGRSFKQSEKAELAFAVLTTFIEPSYYESKDKRVERISKLIVELAKEDPLFVAKLAVVARREFHMRSSSQVTLAELAKAHKGTSLVRKTVVELAERPDDLTELVAYLGKPLPNQIKKGITEALKKFSEYQLAKYRGDGKTVSLVDVFNLVHPKPTKEQETAWKKLVEDELRAKETWESKITAAGSDVDQKSENWKQLVLDDKLGYMALLRNLRNIIKYTDEDTVRIALQKLTDREAVLKSKQLPFRFISAYDAVSATKEDGIPFEKGSSIVDEVKTAIDAAVGYSVENLPLLPGKTVILSDNSGSMTGDGGGASLVSAMSNVKTSDIANLFAALYWMRCDNTSVGLFGDKLIHPKLDRELGVMENFKKIQKASNLCGGSTEHGIFEAFVKLIESKTIVDRIVIFSDMQVGKETWYGHSNGWNGNFQELYTAYKKISPKTMVYSVDLKGNGNQLMKGNLVQLAGWSDKIFQIMEMVEKGNGIVEYIEKYPVLNKVRLNAKAKN